MIRYILFFLLASIQLSAQTLTPGKGRIQRFKNFPSSQVSPRNVDVWLPDGYPKFGPYAVLYMHDGQNLFDSTTSYSGVSWNADRIAMDLLSNRKTKQFIIVGIHNSPQRSLEYTPQAMFKELPEDLKNSFVEEFNGEPVSDKYLLFIVKELKPVIDNSFYTDRSKEYTCIAGASRGGLISLYAMCQYPNIFGTAACISTHWPVSLKENNPDYSKAMISYLNKKLPLFESHRLYFDYGPETLDKQYKPYQIEIDVLLKSKGYSKKNWITKEYPGAEHNEKAWQSRFHDVLKFVMPR
jgi:predicted alpha/beta superfamily hydrolase